jgi:hypothetical protein
MLEANLRYWSPTLDSLQDYTPGCRKMASRFSSLVIEHSVCELSILTMSLMLVFVWRGQLWSHAHPTQEETPLEALTRIETSYWARGKLL